jgi:adenine-specific DNA-methyltransferase
MQSQGTLARHQALFDGLRQILPLVRAEADALLASPHRLEHARALRRARTAAPEALFDGTALIPAAGYRERLATEASLSYLLAQVTLEALRQSYGLSWQRQDLYGLAPELAAYEWFGPTPGLALRVDVLPRAAVLAPLPVQLAGELYEGSLSPDERKAFGQYYTPIPVVRHLLDQAAYLPSNPSIARPILDVATGCGVFLAEASRRAARALWEADMPLDRLCQTLGALLRGYDLHPFTIVATKLYVFASVVDELGLTSADVALLLQWLRLPGIRCADTLVEALRSDPREAPPTWVVGNPPYGQCQEGAHLDPFRAVLHGRANLYQLFLSASLTRCAPGGRIAFLVPESLRAGHFFDRLRRRLTTETTLVATTDFHARTSIFPGVEQGVLILVCQKRAQPMGDGDDTGIDSIGGADGATARAAEVSAPAEAAAPSALVSVAQAANEEDLPTIRPFSVAVSLVQLGAPRRHVLLKAGSREDYALLGKLWSSGESLPPVRLDVHTGRLVWNRHKALLGAKRDGDVAGAGPQALPVIYAPSVHRYRFEFPPRRNNREREHLLFGQRHPALEECATSGEVLLIQRTTSRDQLQRVLATLPPSRFSADHPAYLVENHVNYVDRALVDGAPVPLAYVLGLLNSRLINYLFAALNGTTQVSAVELRLLPLVYPGPGEAAKLAALVQCRLQVAGAAVREVEAAIDRLVYGWYSLGPGERRLIDRYHAVRHTAAGSRVTESLTVGDSDGAARDLVHARASR